MKVGVPKETFPGETRVALVPALVASLKKAGVETIVEAGAGQAAGYPDADYKAAGAEIEADRSAVLAADVVLQVRCAGASDEASREDLQRLTAGQTVIAFADPLGQPETAAQWAARGVTLISMELIPRITRAQSMDALSSMAMVAGYKAVLLAAVELPKMFPLMMTAAGTVTPARVFVVGAGVAGLQAIATARRLGAVVEAYDVRPVVKEEVESLGGKFLELELATDDASAKGGYARQFDEDFYRRQREMMTVAVAEQDVVITTAAIPGRKAPILVTREMVEGMRPGSVILDLAADRGGNCELTTPGETVVHNGVSIMGPSNLPALAPYHSSQMYAKNITTLLLHLLEDGQLSLERDDEIIRETVVATNGQVVHPRVRELLKLEPLAGGDDSDETPAANEKGKAGET